MNIDNSINVPFSSIFVDTGYSIRVGSGVEASADEALIASIQKEGLLIPLTVMLRNNGSQSKRWPGLNGYTIVSGFRRYAAIKELCRRDARFAVFFETVAVFVKLNDAQEDNLSNIKLERNSQ